MAVHYQNRKGKTFYLHRGQTKKGNPKYYFSSKTQGNLPEAIPEGYEIYENPNGQVFLRKIAPQLITQEEREVVERALRELTDLTYYKIDVKKNIISVFVPNQDVEALSEVFTFYRPTESHEALLEQLLDYSAVMQFELVDKQKRLFEVKRYCYLGSIDDWIVIGYSNTLAHQVEEFVGHIGKESYFELF